MFKKLEKSKVGYFVNAVNVYFRLKTGYTNETFEREQKIDYNEVQTGGKCPSTFYREVQIFDINMQNRSPKTHIFFAAIS